MWTTPLPYVAGALFQAVLGLLFLDQLQGRHQALVQPLFPLAGFLLIVAAPILTMRAIAEEDRSGTLDVLLAIPVPGIRVVLGKWLAALFSMSLVVGPAGAYAGLVALYGEPDRGPIVAGFTGLALLGAWLCALGVMASSLTKSQAVAAEVTFFVAIASWFAHQAGPTVRVAGALAHFSSSERLRSFAGGAIDTGDIGFFVASALAFLAVAATAVDARRHR